MKSHVHVWVDRWELNVGESLITRIQEALQDASALLVVLSKSSVKSEWCKKELNAGLIRELEERRVVVLPILLEDCDITLFLKEKMYADFRSNFDEGLRAVLQGIEKVTSSVQNRIETPKYHTDWAEDWGYKDGLLHLRLTLVEQAVGKPYTVLTIVSIVANKQATKRYRLYEKYDIDWMGRFLITEALAESIRKEDLHALLIDQFPKQYYRGIVDQKNNIKYYIVIESRRIGQDTGFDVFVDIKNQLLGVTQQIRSSIRPLTNEETVRMAKIISTPFDG
jgi:hypothetical protein